jgi:uncharacterized metal-binding protein YceD (DUF177 family)
VTQIDEPIFDAVVRIDKLPSSGRSIAVDADDSEREAIARAMDIVSVQRFVAELSVVPFRGGLRAQGRLVADVTQASVVSFEPVDEHIEEEIDRVFLPAQRQGQSPAPGAEIFVDLEDDDFPDHIDGPEVDLSALLMESLALALDPYPRRPGETLEALDGVKLDEKDNPFAQLAKLKPQGDKD